MLPCLGLLALSSLTPTPASCGPAPVRVSLRVAPAARPDADGFITLGAVADLSGGDKAARTRLACIPVCRAPLSGETRRLTRGDLALKLRQAGCDPDKAALLGGAQEAEVTAAEAATEPNPPAPRLPNPPVPFPRKEGGARESVGTEASPFLPRERVPLAVGGGSLPLVHRGDAVTIVIHSDSLLISAAGVAREAGAAGDTIRVHRDGVMTDLAARVVDARTVQLEIQP